MNSLHNGRVSVNPTKKSLAHNPTDSNIRTITLESNMTLWATRIMLVNCFIQSINDCKASWLVLLRTWCPFLYMILSLMASPVTAVAEAEMGFVGVTYWENDLSSVQVPICVTSQSLSEKKKTWNKIYNSVSFYSNLHHVSDTIFTWNGWLNDDIYQDLLFPSQSIQMYTAQLQCVLEGVWWEEGVFLMLSSVLLLMSTSVSYVIPSFTADDSWYRLSSMLFFSCTLLYLLCLCLNVPVIFYNLLSQFHVAHVVERIFSMEW